MATFSKRISAGNNDGYAQVGFGWSGTANDISLGKFAGNLTGALRFDNVTIPVGSTITAATITFFFSSGASNVVPVTIYGINEDNTADFSAGDPTGRTKTTASVNWSIPDPGTINVSQVSPDISSVVQEVLNRVGWASGNALGFIIPNNGSTVGHDFRSYEGDSTRAALLDITYTTATTTSTTTTSTTTTSTSVTTTSTTTTFDPLLDKEFYGMKIFKPKADPLTNLPKDFYLNTKRGILSILKQGSFKSTYIRFIGMSITIPFAELKYRPLILVYMQRMNHDGNMDTDYHLLEWSYWGATKIGYAKYKQYTNRIIIDYSDNLVDDLGVNFSVTGYYYIFRKEVGQ